MQVQDVFGKYDKPQELSPELEKLFKKGTVKRVIVFPAHGEDGKPTKELKKAWRRHNRTQRKKK